MIFVKKEKGKLKLAQVALSKKYESWLEVLLKILIFILEYINVWNIALHSSCVNRNSCTVIAANKLGCGTWAIGTESSMENQKGKDRVLCQNFYLVWMICELMIHWVLMYVTAVIHMKMWVYTLQSFLFFVVVVSFKCFQWHVLWLAVFISVYAAAEDMKCWGLTWWPGIDYLELWDTMTSKGSFSQLWTYWANGTGTHFYIDWSALMWYGQFPMNVFAAYFRLGHFGSWEQLFSFGPAASETCDHLVGSEECS